MSIVSLNSVLIPAEEARIPIDDRGFRFGDGAFETIPVYNHAPYLLSYHIHRLQVGLSALDIQYDIISLPSSIHEVLEANNMAHGIVRLYITRGVGSQGYLPSVPAPSPTTLIQVLSLPKPPTGPVTLWQSQWEKISPKALPVSSKIAQGVNATLARMEARDRECYDALQQSAKGLVCEASSANIFWVKEDQVYTPSLTTGALDGVTRKRMIQLARNVTEGEFTLKDLQEADAVFLTNATMGIIPVAALKPLGFEWESMKIAQRFSTLRQQDIEQRS